MSQRHGWIWCFIWRACNRLLTHAHNIRQQHVHWTKCVIFHLLDRDMSRQLEIWSLATSKLQRQVWDESQTYRSFTKWHKLLVNCECALPLKRIIITAQQQWKADQREKTTGRPSYNGHSLIPAALFYQNCGGALQSTPTDMASCVRLCAYGCVRHTPPHLLWNISS